MKKKKNQKIILLGCIALFTVTSSFAFWSAKITHTNILTADTPKGIIQEVFQQDSQPSGKVTKEVSFQNESSNAAFLRVSYGETWEKSQGMEKVLLNNQVNGLDVAEKNWINGFGQQSDFWTDGQDGWFYYNRVLEPGEQTGNILDFVTFPEYIGDYQSYQGANYQLYFRMELLQASDSSFTLNSEEVNRKASQSVFGKEATVNGELVTWK